MEVRQATLGDLTDLVLLFDGYRQFYQQTSDLHGAHDFLSARLTQKESVIFIALNNQKMIGFCQLYPSFSSQSMERSWILNDLFVAPETRKSDAGRALLEKADAYAKETQSKGLVLCTQQTNTQAQSLYESFGFEHISEFKWYFKSAKNN
ncbi:GNAT family N-acetyltransferase [Catenovulum sp. SM1970]|nr:GNAT family N-acetyltransferase [Marinifaba aquimaris]